jgi:hypothetical protein
LFNVCAGRPAVTSEFVTLCVSKWSAGVIAAPAAADVLELNDGLLPEADAPASFPELARPEVSVPFAAELDVCPLPATSPG